MSTPALIPAAPAMGRQESFHPNTKISDHYWGKYKVEAPSLEFLPSWLEPYKGALAGAGIGVGTALTARSLQLLSPDTLTFTVAGAAIGYLIDGIRLGRKNFSELRPLVNASYELRRCQEAQAIAEAAKGKLDGNTIHPKFKFLSVSTELDARGVDTGSFDSANEEMQEAYDKVAATREKVATYFSNSKPAASRFIKSVGDGTVTETANKDAVADARESLEAVADYRAKQIALGETLKECQHKKSGLSLSNKVDELKKDIAAMKDQAGV